MLLDEVLTMSARMAAVTGDFSYEKRYDQFDPELTKAIDEVRNLLPQQDIKLFVTETDEANLALVKMERQAFALAHEGKRQEAMALLNGGEYARQKKIYADGMQKTINVANDLIEKGYRHLHWLFLGLVAASIVSVLVLLTTWVFASMSARSWARERMESEDALRNSRDELETGVKERTAELSHANEELRHESSVRKLAEKELRESEEKFRSIYESSNDAVMLLTETGFFDCNARTLEMFRLKSKDEFISLHPSRLSPPLQPDGRDSLSAANEKIATAFELGSNRFDWVHRRKNGEDFPAEVMLSAFNFQGKRVLQAIVRDITERKKNEQMLHELASRDGLTGLYNHRTFYAMLEEEIARTQRYKRTVSMLLLDIDHFKRVNDTYGHVAGDRILEGVARVLQQSVRQEDRVCRYGGEEISVILPETDVPTAVQTAERVRAAVEQAVFKDDSGQEIRITASIGVAALPEQAATLRELVEAADTALYAAKEGGRNRVCRHERPAAN
ncbi:MAG: diguanylate cyclase [Gallionellaceae bacterium]|nr:diguanylate cyclase [Gallionellaceae bacterium]